MQPRIHVRRISAATDITIDRALPVPGTILVKPGQNVNAFDLLGQATLCDGFVVVDLSPALQNPAQDPADILLKSPGDVVEAGEILARPKGGFTLGRRPLRTPVAGTLAYVSGSLVLIETSHQQLELSAGVNGQVVAIEANQAVRIQTTGTYIEGVCGLGGRGRGVLTSTSKQRDTNLGAGSFAILDRQSVFLTGGTIDEAGIRQAETVGVTGIIVGSLAPEMRYLDPPPAIPIIATEGYGSALMSPEVFALLLSRVGDEIFVQAQTAQTTRYRQTETFIVLPGIPEGSQKAKAIPNGWVQPEYPVRVVRGHPPTLGKIADVAVAAQDIAPGLTYSGANVALPQGHNFVPWRNIEQVG